MSFNASRWRKPISDFHKLGLSCFTEKLQPPPDYIPNGEADLIMPRVVEFLC